MTEPAAARSVWESLPEFEKVWRWQKAVPGTAARILTQLEADAEFIRKDAARRLAYALVIVVLTLISAVLLAMYNRTAPSIFTSSGGPIAVTNPRLTDGQVRTTLRLA